MSKTISFKLDGDFSKTKGFLQDIRDKVKNATLEKYGKMGVDALFKATPVDTGLTANSWDYVIEQTDTYARITWINTNVKKGYANVALLIQYGHGTGTGGYVEGIDYINPAMQPVFDKIANSLWKEIIS